MTDCPNGEMRDQLPDYVHDRLSAADRALVAAHVASCPSCAAEVELLGAARRAIAAAAPRVDTARIVAALPAPPRARPAFRITSWRMAAAIATIAIGGISFTVIRGIVGGTTPHPAVSSPVVSAPVASAPVTSAPAEDLPENAVVVPDGGHLGDLSDDDVQSLLNDIDQLDGVPDENPQPAIAPVRTGGGGTL